MTGQGPSSGSLNKENKPYVEGKVEKQHPKLYQTSTTQLLHVPGLKKKPQNLKTELN